MRWDYPPLDINPAFSGLVSQPSISWFPGLTIIIVIIIINIIDRRNKF